MKDDFYRNLCENPSEYDAIIALIQEKNPYCEGEDWAANAVNQNISTLLFSTVGNVYCMSGGCCAMLSLGRNAEKLAGHRGKVMLAFRP